MKCYFIATITINNTDRSVYDEYIDQVKPIVTSYGGIYLARTEEITYLSQAWKPDRVIIIEFPSRERLEACFSSKEYQKIMSKRKNTVESHAIIVDGMAIS